VAKKVSIIIPYNIDRGWLNEAVKSVEVQTYQNIELILSQSDKGVSFNINEGIKKATGDYIKYLCEDDKLTPRSIELSVEAMEGNDFIHGNSLILDHNGRISLFVPQSKHPSLGQMAHANQIHGGTLMYRRDVFERFGYFDETLWTGEEYDFNMMLLSKGATLGYCKAALYVYRRHDEQKSLGKKANQRLRKQAIKEIRNRYV
jgi:glycosyltransferase involved in cell wall biosynthesis